MWSLRITGEGLLISGTIPTILSSILLPHIYRVDTNTPSLANKYYSNVLSPNTSAFGVALLSPLSVPPNLHSPSLHISKLARASFFLVPTHSSAVEAPMLLTDEIETRRVSCDRPCMTFFWPFPSTVRPLSFQDLSTAPYGCGGKNLLTPRAVLGVNRALLSLFHSAPIKAAGTICWRLQTVKSRAT